ncbi:MAG: CHASE2 domain-containing protein [Candidatus Omnitrophota bacterium]
MIRQTKCKAIIILICLLLSPAILLLISPLPSIKKLNWKIYDKLVVVEKKLNPVHPKAKDVLIVAIDNKTLTQLPHRWPYPREYFAKVIENLNNAGAKLIGFDFIFLGKSSPEDDLSLKESIQRQKNIVLPITINEQGEIDLFSVNSFSTNIPTGVISKIQDQDDVIRKNITFLVNEDKPDQIYLSWEAQLLNQIKHIDMKSLRYNNSTFYFQDNSGKQWEVPADPATGSFLIHFCCNTCDFNRICFCDVLKNNFDPELVRNKIVLIGFFSQTFGDFHNTPIGWLPGITLNANAFLTLYTQSFIKKISPFIEYAILLIGLIAGCCIFYSFRIKKALLMAGIEIFLFFTLSYLLLIKNYTWNYSLFPILIILSPILSVKIFKAFWRYNSILFAHRDTSLRNLFYKTFNGLKYRITTVQSNSEILESLKTFRPHYIILDPTDTKIPVIEIAKQIKSITPYTNIIIPDTKPSAPEFIFYIILSIKNKKYYIDLPLNKQPKPNIYTKDIPLPPKHPIKKTSSTSSNSLKHILVIDDEKDCLDLIKNFLSRRNCFIETADSGEEALSKISKQRPDIVILDIRMQGMDGLVVLKNIKSRDKSIIVIMATAAKDHRIIKEAFRLGADHYLVKPFSLQELENIIKAH